MDFKDLTPIEQEGQRVLTSEQLAEMYGTTTDAIKLNFNRNKDKFVEGIDFFVLKGSQLKEFKNKVRKYRLSFSKFSAHVYLWTLAGTKKHFTMTRSPKAIIIGKKLGWYYDTKVIACKEGQTLYAIMEAFKGFSMKCQYVVYPYRIDLYFPDYKIAVECDEDGHKDYDRKNEEERQQFLEDSLGCQFVRYNPDSQGFSIFKVINEIFTKVQKSKQ